MAFVPLIERLPSGAHVFGYDPAREIWDGRKVRFVREFSDALPVLDAHHTSMVITGTSLNVTDDAEWWRWAAGHGIASVAFVDQWVNYWQRFSSDGETPFDILPDLIAVVDEVAHSRMLEHGCPADRLRVTGTPLLDLLAAAPREAVADVRAEALAGDPTARLVVFAAEPECRSNTGHSSNAALRAVADTLASTGSTIRLAVRLHPLQEMAALPAERPGLSIAVSEADRTRLLLAADVVVGLGSIFLYESASAGIPTVSVTLGASEPPDLVRAAPAVHSVRRREDLAGVLGQALNQARPADLAVDGRASERFLAAVGLEQA